MSAPPPAAHRLAEALLRACCPRDRLEELEGDLLELFEHRSTTRGRLVAQVQYWREALGLCLRGGMARLRAVPEHQPSRSAQVFPSRVVASIAIAVPVIAMLGYDATRDMFWLFWVILCHVPHPIHFSGTWFDRRPAPSKPRQTNDRA